MNQNDKIDELREEYDLRKLKVRKLGSQRKIFGGTESIKNVEDKQTNNE